MMDLNDAKRERDFLYSLFAILQKERQQLIEKIEIQETKYQCIVTKNARLANRLRKLAMKLRKSLP